MKRCLIVLTMLALLVLVEVQGRSTVVKKGRGKVTIRKPQNPVIKPKSKQEQYQTLPQDSGIARQIQQWQVALVVPPGYQQPGGAPPPAQTSEAQPPPGSIWIQIPGYYQNQNQGGTETGTGSSSPPDGNEKDPCDKESNNNQTTEATQSTTESDEENTTTEAAQTTTEGDDNKETTTTEAGSVETTTSEEEGTSENGNNDEESSSGTEEAGDQSQGQEDEQPSNGDGNATSGTQESNDDLLKDCQGERGQYPSEKSCRHFVNCWDGTAAEQECPSDLVFSETESRCDFPENVDCGNRPYDRSKTATDCSSAEYGTFRNPKNCSEFINCNGGEPETIPCPEGLDYNEEYGVCDYPYNVDCKGSPSAGDNPQPQNDDGEQDGNDVEDEEPPPNFLIKRRRPGVIRTKSRCAPGSVNILEKSCSVVSICDSRGYARVINCPKKTAYDKRARRCVALSRARCH